MGTILFATYVLCVSALVAYGANCYYMVWRFWRTRRRETERMRRIIESHSGRFSDLSSIPHVTTQIPLYNEANVAERIIRAAAAIDYPAEKHEIQVLDDSTDETRNIIDLVAEELRREGKDVTVFRRENREGYKAGALAEGMKLCKGEFIAIFDSDFVPPAVFLKNMLPLMIEDEKLGFLQARWGHLNPKQSFLTRAQSIGIDGHFMVEQSARAFNGFFLNFNGTAGIWRKKAIEEAGGWQADTLTEDMDLSYRCQLVGWRGEYLPDMVVPAELPESYTAFKSQQFRWAKGSMQTAIKLLPRILRSESGLMAKIQAVFHLTHYSIHPIMACLSILTLPVLMTLDVEVPLPLLFLCVIGVWISIFGPSTLYVTSLLADRSGYRRLFFLPVLMCVGVGIALSNTRAVFEAVTGVKSGFVRTPKRGADNKKNYKVPAPVLPLFEIILSLYCVVSLFQYIDAGQYLVGPFLLIYACGFMIVGIGTMRESFSS